MGSKGLEKDQKATLLGSTPAMGREYSLQLHRKGGVVQSEGLDSQVSSLALDVGDR